MEELFWRGYMHRKLEVMQNRSLAISIINLIFTAQHFFIVFSIIKDGFSVCFFLLAIFTGGIVWGYMREYTKSTIAAMISHMFATAGYMTVFYLYFL